MAALEVIALDEATPQLRAPASGDTYAVPRALAFADLVTLAAEDGLTAFAGGGKGSATPLDATKNIHRVSTVATAGNSVLMPPALAGQAHYVRNDGAQSMQVFGQGTDTINAVATGTGISHGNGMGAWYVCEVNGAWTTSPVNSLKITGDSSLGAMAVSSAGAVTGITTAVMSGNLSLNAIVWTSNGVKMVGGAGSACGIGFVSGDMLSINQGSNIGIFRDFKVRQHYVDQTVTGGGTTGDQTINKGAGTVNFAAAATAITVTNSLVTSNSTILVTVRTNDTTAEIKNVVPTAGAFTINLAAAATAETSVGFVVIN